MTGSRGMNREEILKLRKMTDRMFKAIDEGEISTAELAMEAWELCDKMWEAWKYAKSEFDPSTLKEGALRIRKSVEAVEVLLADAMEEAKLPRMRRECGRKITVCRQRLEELKKEKEDGYE